MTVGNESKDSPVSRPVLAFLPEEEQVFLGDGAFEQGAEPVMFGTNETEVLSYKNYSSQEVVALIVTWHLWTIWLRSKSVFAIDHPG